MPPTDPTPTCTCAAIREAMVDGSHNPEGAEEWRESHGHYPGCPLSPPEPTPPTDAPEFPPANELPCAPCRESLRAITIFRTDGPDTFDVRMSADQYETLRRAHARVAELEAVVVEVRPFVETCAKAIICPRDNTMSRLLVKIDKVMPAASARQAAPGEKGAEPR